MIRGARECSPCSSQKSVRSELFRPLACPSRLDHNILLFDCFSNYQFLMLAPLANATPALSAL